MAGVIPNVNTEQIKIINTNQARFYVTSQKPRDNIPIVKCTFVNTDDVLLDGKEPTKVVCLSDGNVLELIGENIVSRCRTTFLEPSDIAVFYSYDPFTKYYIVSQTTEIIVLKKLDNDLELFRTYKNVQKYEIGDFLVIGRPQVKIWFLDEMEPILTNFSVCDLNELKGGIRSHQMLELNRKLFLMKSSLNEMNRIMEDREVVVEKCLKKIFVDETLLTISENPWQKILNGKWIICVTVRNNSKHTLSIKHLKVTNGYLGEIETRISKSLNFTNEFISENELKPDGCAHVIGIVKIPNFNSLNDNLTLTCSLLYSISDDINSSKELMIPPFELTTEDLMAGRLGFSNTEITDLIQYVMINTAICETVTKLQFHFKNCTDFTSFVSVVINTFQFSALEGVVKDKKCLCHISNSRSKSMLSGLIVFVEKVAEQIISFDCYAKDLDQLILFKNSLMVHFKDDLSDIVQCDVNSCHEETMPILAAVNTLNEEFSHFSSAVKAAMPVPSTPISKNSNVTFTIDTWKALRESINLLNTDQNFFNVSERMCDVQLC